MPSTATTFAWDQANATAPAGAIEQAIAAAGAPALTADAPDADLIAMAQSGNTRAFDVLVKRYRGRVYLLAYHQTKSHEDALDITQEAFIRAYKALPKWQPKASWFTWLYKIARNLCIDFHRSRNRRRTDSLDEPESTVPEPTTTDLMSDPGRTTQESELSGIIHEAVETLSTRQREVFVLHHYGGLQVKEVADTLDIAEGTAKIHLFRAVAKLREILGPMRARDDI
ncbi:RNA polymerase sigma factor [Candidatus Poribacteria bacterium]|jgi:RNA polymerase sigma-70 factor, ECF subfamily|nr:RNA polymerase sigma factor [Candidatus Poribacteria bacterium]MBT5534690.1 RNA polymerase sigma factor [Candidatus Poribacteria bacterium]MBT5711060.1 RNA polymerase sigma factor [Candidatus Poribacteria bacterium]MBT7099270.1 RNA polymerase sigma factor [Candidatus Poribacteria bacterium]MBT7809349.1 RNA polymerase sigma factor [Candidatus Poribacteria bacterium]